MNSGIELRQWHIAETNWRNSQCRPARLYLISAVPEAAARLDELARSPRVQGYCQGVRHWKALAPQLHLALRCAVQQPDAPIWVVLHHPNVVEVAVLLLQSALHTPHGLP